MDDDSVNDESQAGKEEKADATVEPPEVTFRAFLEKVPPDTYVRLFDLEGSNSTNYISMPDVLLDCESADCDGLRMFRTSDALFATPRWNYSFLKYVCRNCGTKTASFAVTIKISQMPVKDARGSGIAMKLGQIPTFGPRTPAKLLRLIEPDRELFLQGRRAEIKGLGIGAFAYYRRVVENQRSRIIGRIAKVAKVVGSTPEIDAQFTAAINEIQFSKSIEIVKDFIPQALLIGGENPLTLLHSALSKGLHNPEMTDSHCLELAQSIRTVLAELADRATSVTKDDKEIQEAINVLKSVPRGSKLTAENVLVEDSSKSAPAVE